MKKNLLNGSKKFLLFILLALSAFMAWGCGEEDEPPLDPVKLTIVGAWDECMAVEMISSEFNRKYPNCTVIYEPLQNYYESVKLRMTGDYAVDLFFTNNIQSGDPLLEYAVDFNGRDDIDLSDTFKGLIDNFRYIDKDPDTNELYAIPLGADMRGMYVNVSLLKSLNIEVPTNQAELLAACETLKENGYTPLQGNPSNFSHWFLYPWVCNTIANSSDYAATYARVNELDAETVHLFDEQYNFLYSVIKNDYYDYKTNENIGLFKDTTNEATARYLLNIVAAEGKTDEFVNGEGAGKVAFMPGPLSLKPTIDKALEDYNNKNEYVFIPAPVGVDGGYVYLSPANGIAANKLSNNLEWSLKFIDFLFEEENNKKFAEEFDILPNTKDVFDYITNLYDIPSNHISHLGQVTFDNKFYDYIRKNLTNLSKGNNPKYMINLNKDENGNIQYLKDENDKEYLLLNDGKTIIYKEYVGEIDPEDSSRAYCSLAYYQSRFLLDFTE